MCRLRDVILLVVGGADVAEFGMSATLRDV